MALRGSRNNVRDDGLVASAVDWDSSPRMVESRAGLSVHAYLENQEGHQDKRALIVQPVTQPFWEMNPNQLHLPQGHHHEHCSETREVPCFVVDELLHFIDQTYSLCGRSHPHEKNWNGRECDDCSQSNVCIDVVRQPPTRDDRGDE